MGAVNSRPLVLGGGCSALDNLSGSKFLSGCRFFLITLVASGILGAKAHSQSTVEQIAQLNATGQSAAAYQLSMQMLPEYEGDPAFDVHYGVAAVDVGNASEGAFALERVLMNQPANDYARLELGRAYFALEEDDRAEAEFNRVLEANPPQEVVENVQPYLNAIESRRYKREESFVANLSIGGGHDSNILAAPDDDTFFIPLLNGEATLSNTAEADSFFQVNADATYSRPIRYGTNAFVSGQFNRRDNDSGVTDIMGYGGKLGLTHEAGANNFRVALELDTLDVDSNNYRDSHGLSASWRHSLSAQTAFTFFGRGSQLKYNDLAFKDAFMTMIGFNGQHQIIAPYRPVLSMGLILGNEDAENDQLSGALQNTERDIWGINGGLTLSLQRNLQLSAGWSIQSSEYAAEESLFFVTREDTQYTGKLGLSWLPMDNLLVKLDGSMGKTDSNVPILEYDRDQITLSMRYSYK